MSNLFTKYTLIKPYLTENAPFVNYFIKVVYLDKVVYQKTVSI